MGEVAGFGKVGVVGVGAAAVAAGANIGGGGVVDLPLHCVDHGG